MTLAQLSDSTQSRINALVAKFGDKKGWHISEIVAEYRADSAVTPEHLLLGLKGKQNIGTAYAAWYSHKSGIDSKVLNITFIANNYGIIQVKNTPEDMKAELARVNSLVVDEKRTQAYADAMAGTAIVNVLEDTSDDFDKLGKTVIVVTPASDALVMAMKVKMDEFLAKYEASRTLVKEKESINA